MKLTLCGSLRFEPYWHEANKQLGLAGHICYSVMTFPSIEGDKSWYTPEQKWALDLAHFAKIEESDGVVMLNVNGYLGESSLRELEWARMRNKKVFWSAQDVRAKLTEFYAKGLITGILKPVFFSVNPNHNDEDWTELLDAVKTNAKR